MNYNTLLVEKEQNIAIVRLNRPQAMNSLTLELMTEIGRCFRELESDEEVNAVVLTGNDRAFCAGLDMETVMHGLNPENKMASIDICEESFIRIMKFPLPVIAAVSGPALAAGFDLMVMADIRVMSQTAKLGQPEILWALTQLTDPLWKIIGQGRAKEVAMTGRIYGADEAFQMGLANYVFPVETYFQEAKKLAHRIASFDRSALKATKDQSNRVPGMEPEAAVRTQLWAFRNFVGSDEMTRRMTAFKESKKK